MKDDKYAVFKIGDWLEEWKQWQDPGDALHPLTDLQRKRLDDAVVIRTQDVFAGPALHAYAANISTAISVIRGAEDSGELAKVADRLQAIADHFHEAALEADDKAGKIPD